MNETYYTTLDLTNTCDKDIQYPGVNSTVDNPLVEGLYDYTEWFYMMPSMSTYNMSWQLVVNETIPNGTDITLTFDAAILGCSDEDESQWHFCPTSTLSHTFTMITDSGTSNNTNETTQQRNNKESLHHFIHARTLGSRYIWYIWISNDYYRKSTL